MAAPGGFLLGALATLLAAYLKVNSSHDIQLWWQQELGMASWRQGQENPSFLMASTRSWLPLWWDPNSSTAASPSEISASVAKQFLEESSAPATESLQVVLHVLPDPSAPPYLEGSRLTLQAHIQLASREDMKLYVDECAGTQSQCLSVGSGSGSWSQLDNEMLQFSVDAFLLNSDVEEDEVYIICWTRIWNWIKPFEPGRKSCFYNTSSNSWQLADWKWKNWHPEDIAWENSVCECCDIDCFPPKKGQYREFPEEGKSHKVVTGPLKVKKLPMSWFKASCRTLKDLLAATLAFACLVLLLVVSLLTLRKVLRVYSLLYLLGRWGHIPGAAQESPDTVEMDWVSAAATGCFCREEDLAPSED